MTTSLQLLAVIFTLTAVSSATPLGHHYGGEEHSGGHYVDYHAHPKYHYDYSVHDLHTGDVKNKWETRDGDVVKGYYSLNEPDGTIRKVEYTADKHNGFNAVVKKLGKSYHPEPVKHHNHHHDGHYGALAGGNFGSAGHFEASSYSNMNIHRLGHHHGHHY